MLLRRMKEHVAELQALKEKGHGWESEGQKQDFRRRFALLVAEKDEALAAAMRCALMEEALNSAMPGQEL